MWRNRWHFRFCSFWPPFCGSDTVFLCNGTSARKEPLGLGVALPLLPVGEVFFGSVTERCSHYCLLIGNKIHQVGAYVDDEVFTLSLWGTPPIQPQSEWPSLLINTYCAKTPVWIHLFTKVEIFSGASITRFTSHTLILYEWYGPSFCPIVSSVPEKLWPKGFV